MRKIMLVVMLLFVLLILVGCNGNGDTIEGDNGANVKISGWTDDTLFLNNLGQAGEAKLYIEYVKQNSIEETVEETEVIAVTKGEQTYQLSPNEEFIPSAIVVYSLQDGEWVKTDSNIEVL